MLTGNFTGCILHYCDTAVQLMIGALLQQYKIVALSDTYLLLFPVGMFSVLIYPGGVTAH